MTWILQSVQMGHTDHMMDDRSIGLDFRHLRIFFFFFATETIQNLGLSRIRSRVHLKNFAGGEAAGTWP
jgi:hypothetical protein